MSKQKDKSCKKSRRSVEFSRFNRCGGQNLNARYLAIWSQMGLPAPTDTSRYFEVVGHRPSPDLNSDSQIPRCFRRSTQSSDYQLHVFTDALEL
jgi:hypothetical protein